MSTPEGNNKPTINLSAKITAVFTCCNNSNQDVANNKQKINENPNQIVRNDSGEDLKVEVGDALESTLRKENKVKNQNEVKIS